MSTTPIFDEHELPPSPALAGGSLGNTMPASFDALPTPVIDCDTQGVMVAINLAAQNLEQTNGLKFLGQEIWSVVAPEYRQGTRNAFFTLLERGGEDPHSIRRSINMPNGGFRTYQINRAFLRNATGEITGLRMVLSDVTEHTVAYQREKTARLWLESVTDALAEAVVVTDALGLIRFANPAAVQLTGWQESELLHMSITRAVPILSYSRAEGVPFNYRLVLERRSSGIITFLTKQQQQATVAFSTAPVLDKIQGSTTGVSYVFRKPDVNL